MRFSIKDLGCKVNAYEAAWYRQELIKQGWKDVEFGQPADVVIINSCTVTNTAGAKSRQMLHAARQANPQAVIAIVGCYVQMTGQQPEIFADADLVLGTSHKMELCELLTKAVAERQKIIKVDELTNCPFDVMMVNHFDHARAYLKIQDGCQQFCSYCVIPYARGPQRCLSKQQAILGARQLTAAGYQEIVLAGIHTGRYQDGNTDLAGLMTALLQDEKLKRLRLSSIEMTEISDQLIQLMKRDERVARHLHIPLQSGSDRILKAMNRPYTTKEYADRLAQIRAELPGISVSTDIIVGFPGETEEMFNETLAFASECGFTFIHVFPYAAKQHTVAACMPNQVSGPIKKQRVADLTALSKHLYNKAATTMIGKTVSVLVETGQDGIWKGHCSEYLTVKLTGGEQLRHQLVNVQITELKDGELWGRVEGQE